MHLLAGLNRIYLVYLTTVPQIQAVFILQMHSVQCSVIFGVFEEQDCKGYGQTFICICIVVFQLDQQTKKKKDPHGKRLVIMDNYYILHFLAEQTQFSAMVRIAEYRWKY
jgi:hypothetical protein